MKECFKCKITKPLDDFYKHPQMTDGRVGKCKECNKLDVRGNYALKKDYYKKYDSNRQKNSIKRMLDHRYNQMRQRVEGKATHVSSSQGKDLLTREEYYHWCEQTKEQFQIIYDNWKKENYPFKLAPSIDRISNTKGYTSDNMQWLTQSQNCSKH